MKFLLNKKLMLAAALVISLVASHFSEHINSYYLQVFITVGINVILATSLNLINGYTGQFSLGHAGFMAVGAYASTVVTLGIAVPAVDYPEGATSLIGHATQGIFYSLGWAFNHLFIAPVNGLFAGLHALPHWAEFPGALLVGGTLAAATGWIVGVPSLRLKGDYLAIVTLGFGEIIRVLIQNTTFIGAARGLNSIPGFTTLFSSFAVAAVTIYVVVSLIDSTYGRGFLTVRDDEIAAEAMGINTTRYKVTAFVLGAFIAGIAGGLYAHTKNAIDPGGFDFQRSVEIVVMVILGGMGSTAGVAFAAILLTILLEYLRFVAGYEFLPNVVREIAKNRMIIYSLVLIALMLLRPQGLFGGIRAFGPKASRTVPKAA